MFFFQIFNLFLEYESDIEDSYHGINKLLSGSDFSLPSLEQDKPLVDVTGDIDLVMIKNLLESPVNSSFFDRDPGWHKMIQAFPLNRNLVQGTVSHSEYYDVPVMLKDLGETNPNMVYRPDHKCWISLAADNFKINSCQKNEVSSSEDERVEEKSKAKIKRNRSFTASASNVRRSFMRRSNRKLRSSSSFNDLDKSLVPKIDTSTPKSNGIHFGETVSPILDNGRSLRQKKGRHHIEHIAIKHTGSTLSNGRLLLKKIEN